MGFHLNQISNKKTNNNSGTAMSDTVAVLQNGHLRN